MARKALFVHHGVYRSLGFVAERAEERGFDVVPVRSPDGLDPRDFDIAVVLGSDQSVYDESVEWLAGEKAFVDAALDAELPVFGICFGSQLLADRLGGSVGPAARGELGWTTIDSRAPELVDSGPWFEMHGDTLTLPPGATELARNDCGVQAFERGNVLGVQFHPEVNEQHVREWMTEAADFVERAGADPGQVLKETAEVIDDARFRAYRLFDRVWERIGR